ncbi:MAG: hypothetical protein IE916_11550 [Epsilonproteobacteria bacterium]|nr:hypothetical protein [Campylobacterota bacterium]
MKYIIDLIEDIRESIDNAADYSLLAILLKEAQNGELEYAGEKTITSFRLDRTTKRLLMGFEAQNATTRHLLELLETLEMDAMMYEIYIEISSKHPQMEVVGFGEDRVQKHYTLFLQV